ncbi:unnamed protein product [Paramecium pentaurelia]|uniref:Uncharacterized protein n=1 Tax=Paramecium pentaurelia TaxID=43138 RepID=A0A8S1WGL0_9CILI|nr:unnamed protein product [Paramecium pentaurelia]
MSPFISFLKIIFLNSIIYQNCLTNIEEDCKYTDFSIVGTSNATTDRCGSDDYNLYMGAYGFQSTVSKTFPRIPPNHGLELQVGIWKLDSWDSEGFEIWANDQLIENLIYTGPKGNTICRNEIFQDQFTHLKLKFQITEEDLTIKFKDKLNTMAIESDLWDESWGFRDMILRLSIPCVNFYSECNYQGTLFQICKGEQTKQQDDIPFEIKSIFMGPNIIVQFKDPNYFGGNLQEFTSSEPCLDSYSQSKTYKFPKQNQLE